MRPDQLGDPREPCGLTYAQLGELSDEAIMAHLRGSHGDAVAVLLDRYGKLVLSIASKIVRDTGEAEEVVQEVFVDLCRTAAQFDAAKGTAKLWIIRTAYRRSLNKRRQLNNHHFYAQCDPAESSGSQIADSRSLLPSLNVPESRRLVEQGLASIDGAQRRVLELVFFEGLTLRDVAERTGDSIESVRHRYYRGMHRMREVLRLGNSAKSTSTQQETLDANA